MSSLSARRHRKAGGGKPLAATHPTTSRGGGGFPRFSKPTSTRAPRISAETGHPSCTALHSSTAAQLVKATRRSATSTRSAVVQWGARVIRPRAPSRAIALHCSVALQGAFPSYLPPSLSDRQVRLSYLWGPYTDRYKLKMKVGGLKDRLHHLSAWAL